MQSEITKILSEISKILYFYSFLLMTFFSNLSVCSLIVKHKQYKIPNSILFREWRAIFLAPPSLVDLLYRRTKKFESSKLQELVKPSLKSAVSFQEVGMLSTTTYGLQQLTRRPSPLGDHVLSLLLRFGTLIVP